jgi:pyruvate/2-oxoglutarate dehydrogenase complex dihydrolipoamide dehydrogenase (E3) component
VELWEADAQLGGQLRVAALAPSYGKYATYLDWQEQRLDRLGVTVRLDQRATADDVAAAGADVVVVATGATPHRPGVPGIDLPHVVDIRDVLRGTAAVGDLVLIVAQDDHLPPLSLADALSEQGRDVTLLYGSAQPAQQLGRYILGGILTRLLRRGVVFRHLEELVAIAPDTVTVRNVYSQVTQELGGFDTVALACGGDSDAGLFDELRDRVPEVHMLGDAYAPRRLVFATRQAYALAQQLAE